MRIISGRYKGTKLFLPPDDLIRPTSDRAKEMIFSTLNSILSKKKLKFDKDNTETTIGKRDFIYDFLSSMRQKINDPLGVRKKRREQGQ